ncbi:hypothetical protein ACFQ7F_24815 [Streptomyces sp. NPDC056486]|uniref:hypothetical protein n=1 Tax=Streptomyces sp. NPDC056486 TaxID=3345835 RepID=UPI00368F7ABB
MPSLTHGTDPVRRSPGAVERERVREMLTYLAAALPRFSSPAARLLALQCALRADSQGHVELPEGFLRGMRLASHAAPWHELEHAGWLRCTARRHGRTQAQILDAAILHQAPGRQERARAAHWALHPTPLAAPHGAPPSMQLAALVLAVHTEASRGSADLDDLTRLCTADAASLKDLLDQFMHSRRLVTWRQDLETSEVCWQLPPAQG